MAKKKFTTNSEKRYPGQEKSIKLLPKAKPDPEEDPMASLKAEEDSEEELDKFIEDELKSMDPNRHAHIKYPAPKKELAFRKKWNELIDGVVTRENFKVGHLGQLEILCDLYVEYAQLSKFIRTRGYTYTAFGRQGKTIKPFPQVAQLNRVQSEIRSYSKMLGLLLVKDKDPTSGGESSNWD